MKRKADVSFCLITFNLAYRSLDRSKRGGSFCPLLGLFAGGCRNHLRDCGLGVFPAPQPALFPSGSGDFFLLVLFLAVLVGILLYWLQVWLFPKCRISLRVLNLSEYIIQWGLIYITGYQVLFDSLFAKESLDSLSQLKLSNPTDLMSLILPALISVWIALILYKMRQKEIYFTGHSFSKWSGCKALFP